MPHQDCSHPLHIISLFSFWSSILFSWSQDASSMQTQQCTSLFQSCSRYARHLDMMLLHSVLWQQSTLQSDRLLLRLESTFLLLSVSGSRKVWKLPCRRSQRQLCRWSQPVWRCFWSLPIFRQLPLHCRRHLQKMAPTRETSPVLIREAVLPNQPEMTTIPLIQLKITATLTGRKWPGTSHAPQQRQAPGQTAAVNLVSWWKKQPEARLKSMFMLQISWPMETSLKESRHWWTETRYRSPCIPTWSTPHLTRDSMSYPFRLSMILMMTQMRNLTEKPEKNWRKSFPATVCIVWESQRTASENWPTANTKSRLWMTWRTSRSVWQAPTFWWNAIRDGEQTQQTWTGQRLTQPCSRTP